MTIKKNKKRHPADLLFKNLFEECTPAESFKLIAEGISASYRNADRLLSDVQYLIDGDRLSSARFILTTAREEIAKSYILLDMCRLDWQRHNCVLRRLCGAFYNHIEKHAYLEVLDFPNIHSMADVKRLWEIEIKRLWPAPFESGEPDMPHDTYFNRELPLYIDYGDYDRRWLIPTDSEEKIYFEREGGRRIYQIKRRIETWKQAESIDIYSSKILAILNTVFKKHYLQEDTTRMELCRLYETTAQRVSQEIGITPDLFMDSPLLRLQWPLYHFVSTLRPE